MLSTLTQERKQGGGGTWHCFDDNAVDPWDVACLEKDCYGGRFTADVWDAKSNQHVPHVRGTSPEDLQPTHAQDSARFAVAPCTGIGFSN